MTVSQKTDVFIHKPVMVREVCEGLHLQNSKVVVDGTLGLGGHSKMILQKLPKSGKVIAFDLDEGNLKVAQKNLKAYAKQVVFVNNNFSALSKELLKLKIKKIDGLLLDLGISSVHVDDAEKGFSFLKEGPLDMRFDKKQSLTAEEILRKYSEQELTRIFKEYGEEKHAKKIAKAIVVERRMKPFTSTVEFAQFLEKLLKHKEKKHPATRVFQALRIEVNRELQSLLSVLEQALLFLNKGGRIVVISYHSLEDRLVKNFFRDHARTFINLPHEMKTTTLVPSLKIITKKPLVPTAEEIQENPRSRSAKVRIAEKI